MYPGGIRHSTQEASGIVPRRHQALYPGGIKEYLPRHTHKPTNSKTNKQTARQTNKQQDKQTTRIQYTYGTGLTQAYIVTYIKVLLLDCSVPRFKKEKKSRKNVILHKSVLTSSIQVRDTWNGVLFCLAQCVLTFYCMLVNNKDLNTTILSKSLILGVD